ncbi:MAG TPA: PH domain-containing protein [Candidatus Angelobacter sp.]|nr:PH domain-containing protein [Candidatus Angelobacter sp.]
MSYVDQHLIAGESIKYQTKLHWIVVLGHLTSAVFFALLGIAILIARLAAPKRSAPSPVMYFAALFCVMLAAGLSAVGFFRRNATEMAVTNKRVIAKTGLADRRTIELLLSRIESVVVDEPPLGRILGYGTVILRGIGGTPETFERIQNPLKFRQQVQSQIDGESKALK